MRFASLAPCLIACALACASQACAGVKWQGWDAGLAAAKRSHRYVLVDVYTDWCGWCKRMDADVYARADVSDYLNHHFASLRLDAEGGQLLTYQGESRSARVIAAGFRVTGYPTTIFLNSAGEHLVNVPGYLPADRFLLLLRYISDGHMEKGVTWEAYMKQQGADQ